MMMMLSEVITIKIDEFEEGLKEIKCHFIELDNMTLKNSMGSALAESSYEKGYENIGAMAFPHTVHPPTPRAFLQSLTCSSGNEERSRFPSGQRGSTRTRAFASASRSISQVAAIKRPQAAR